MLKLVQESSHEYVIRIADKKSGLIAYVAIHSTVLGPAHGGTRMMVYGSEDEALTDALNLSKAMSYKSALARLPYGGAKGVIFLPKNAQPERKALLKAYAQKIDKLGGLFHTGTDVGLTDRDTQKMKQYSRFVIGLPKDGSSEWTTSNAAANGVYKALVAAHQAVNGTTNLRGVKVAVKGAGKLGSHLIEKLHESGATLVISDVDPEKTKTITARFPDITVVNADTIHAEKVDIYAPCALGQEFTQEKVQELNCSIIVGGANNQLASDEVGDKIYERRIYYVPDYVANAGGLIFVCEDLEKDGFKPERVDKRLSQISSTVSEILKKSLEQNLPPHRVADKMAQEIIENGAP